MNSKQFFYSFQDCPTCGKTFNHRGTLNRHMKTHNKTENKFNCEEYFKSFSHKHDLNRHQKSHTNEKLSICEECNTSFKLKQHLNRHLNIHKKNVTFQCEECQTTFTRKDDLSRHRVRYNARPLSHVYKDCNKHFSKKSNLLQHRRTHHTIKPLVIIKKTTAKPRKRRPTEKALNNFSITTIEATEENTYEIDFFHSQIIDEVQNHIYKTIHETRSIKWHLIHTVKFQRINDAEEIEAMNAYFRCDPCPEHIEETVRGHIIETFQKIKTQYEDFILKNGSGWFLDRISHTVLYLSHYKPLAGSSYIEKLNLKNLKEKKKN